MTNELPGIEKNIEEGNFAPIKAWLNEKIHRQGSLFTPHDLVCRVTGESLNAEYYIDYLRRKYSIIYQL
jgi:carboxypeptidase Taq